MKRRPNLTKENFWNDIMDQFPEQMHHFCKWIDNYKASNAWDYIFAPFVLDEKTKEHRPPKYHELPYSFQLAIWMEYVWDVSQNTDDDPGLFRNRVSGMFAELKIVYDAAKQSGVSIPDNYHTLKEYQNSLEDKPFIID